MGAPILTADANLLCPHGGQGTIVPSQAAVMAGGTVCTEADQVVIAGCPFFIGPDPSPCVSVIWQTAAVSCTADGPAILTADSLGLCLNPAGLPQGPAVLSPAQAAAVAT
jgi:hypothetical protein